MLSPEQIQRKKAKQSLTRLREDFRFYADKMLKIRTKTGDIISFSPLKPAQDRLLDVIERQKATQGYVRVLILKARQQGLSTVTGGFIYSEVSQRVGAKALVMAHKKDSTDALFAMVRRFYDSTPEAMRPATRYASKRELFFNNLDSSYIVATAGGEAVARGETITHFHGSEVAFWPKKGARDLWNGIRNSIADAPGTFIALESTANGVSGPFYEMCQLAMRGLLPGWELVFIPWFLEPEYRAQALPGDWKRTPEEQEVAAKFGVDDLQLAWRRAKIAETSADQFKQEYPATPDEAFLASGLPVFNPAQLVDLLAQCPLEPELDRRTLEMRFEPGSKEPTPVWASNYRGELVVYEEPRADQSYAIGADVGKGIKGGDFSVAQVINADKRVVAVWRGHVIADYFGTVLNHLGNWYNTARVLVENNDHGLLTNYVLSKELNYPNLYSSIQYDKEQDKETEVIGFTTNVKTRPMVLDQLRAAFREKAIDIKDRETLTEMMRFVVNDSGKMEAEEGSHDDCVMALAFANHAAGTLWKPVTMSEDWYSEAYY